LEVVFESKGDDKEGSYAMNYFEHPYCSNSDLSKLKGELSQQDQQEYAEALRFGTLVHAIILEPHKVDLIRRMVDDYCYTPEEIRIARCMKVSFLNDSFCRDLLARSDVEVEMYNPKTDFEHNGISFTLSTRRKYDGWLSLVNWGWDLKSTTATNQDQFLSAISQFDYDRARVFYAAGSGAMQDVIIGVSKVAPYRVFKVFMKHGDALWKSGVQKCNELTFKYWMLKQEVTI
jgi:hypothetical protein